MWFNISQSLAGRLEPPPALKPVPAGESIPLDRPDLEREDPQLTSLLERRRSIWEYGARPITVRQLGEFLYRVARVRAYREVEAETPQGPVRMTVATRPYPAGGALFLIGSPSRPEELRG